MYTPETKLATPLKITNPVQIGCISINMATNIAINSNIVLKTPINSSADKSNLSDFNFEPSSDFMKITSFT
jgi:hypothetical protein